MTNRRYPAPYDLYTKARGPILPVYVCPICTKHHPTEAAARACALSTEEPLARAGDIVVMEPGYPVNQFVGANADDPWLLDFKGHKFHGQPTARVLYVVTSVTQDPGAGYRSHDPEGIRAAHRLAYHVHTPLKLAENRQGRCGWTNPNGHHGFKPYNGDRLSALRDAAVPFIGLQQQGLL